MQMRPTFPGLLPLTFRPLDCQPRIVRQLADEREYRLCKAVVDHPLRPSSQYARLAGMGPKTAIKVRQALIAKGFIVERPLDSSGRGRTAILLEPTPAGTDAVAQYRGSTP